MVLFITDSSTAGECARALTAANHAKAEVAPDMRSALARLREREYRVVVLDDSMAELSPAQLDVVLKHVGAAVPVFVNFGISGKDRVLRDITTAIRRVEDEKNHARRAVEWELRSELKADLTGILLSAQQALDSRELPPLAEAKVRSVCELAERIRNRLALHRD